MNNKHDAIGLLSYIVSISVLIGMLLNTGESLAWFISLIAAILVFLFCWMLIDKVEK